MEHRYLREWLKALSATGFVSNNSKTGFFSLSDEQYNVLGDESSTSLMIGGFSKVEMTYKTASNMVIEARV